MRRRRGPEQEVVVKRHNPPRALGIEPNLLFSPWESMQRGYSRLGDDPCLCPPSRDYVESYCKSQQLAQTGISSRTIPLTSTSERQDSQRLFDAKPGDAGDYASFCSALSQDPSYRGLRHEVESRQGGMHIHGTSLTLGILGLTQSACAWLFGYTLWVDPASGAVDHASLTTCGVIFASGVLGFIGGALRSQWSLRAFFLSQIWALALVCGQWLRSQQQSDRTMIFCEQHIAGQAMSYRCAAAIDTAQVAAILLSLVVAYASMFVSDMLVERLQDELEHQDQVALVRFSWLMHRKTLVGIQRFEDRIRSKFEELVMLGFLKPRHSPTKTLG